VSAVETRRPGARGQGAPRPGAGRRGEGSRRSDAERNVEAILDAASSLFRTRVDASMTEIAKAAGLGRVTVYGHFESREHLVEALLARATSEAERIVAAGELDRGSAPEALARLVRTSWRTLDRHRGLHAVAARTLPPERLRQHHLGVLQHLDGLVERGQEAGDFRADLPRDWLVSVVYAVMHNAADEVDAGRLAADDAADALVATLTGALAAPR
jgi:AcrR family transcriptional regulator